MNTSAPMFSAAALALGLALLAATLAALQTQSAHLAPATTFGGAQPDHLIIPAQVLPPFDPAATRATEESGALVVLLADGDTRQDLHIAAAANPPRHDTVRVIHARHGEVITLHIATRCDAAADRGAAGGANTWTRPCAPTAA
ncbi:MAG: hypothetical protein JNM76_00805 [Betaproteobacteria bacterium]|nr:hypothetical protein [Betaproteobacteria bacterium]